QRHENLLDSIKSYIDRNFYEPIRLDTLATKFNVSPYYVSHEFIGFGGGKVLNKFTAILNPCIYIVFGGMAIWAISLVGIGPILD
ncbi:cytosine permease, partial [Salmonella enterica subsp. enterica serovar Virginia]|nr:cytosine permease [Salmonella enterica subsp. enterica serovar Virginia]